MNGMYYPWHHRHHHRHHHHQFYGNGNQMAGMNGAAGMGAAGMAGGMAGAGGQLAGNGLNGAAGVGAAGVGGNGQAAGMAGQAGAGRTSSIATTITMSAPAATKPVVSKRAPRTRPLERRRVCRVWRDSATEARTRRASEQPRWGWLARSFTAGL